MKRNLLTLNDLSGAEMEEIFQLAALHKSKLKDGQPRRSLAGKTLGLIFKKSSTRTRISFEVGMFQLGGHALLLNLATMHWDKSESIRDSARVFSRYLDAVAIRTFDQREVEELTAYSDIPVINALTDDYHPCQILADIFTLRERFGDVRGIRVAYVGDGNNVAHSWIIGAVKTGIHLVVCTPEGYAPKREALASVKRDDENIGSVEFRPDPRDAVRDADVIYTDVWASMGQEDTIEERRRIFAPFQINTGLLRSAGKGTLVMHCLPAHRGDEITDEVIDGEQSIVFDEAENRLHTQKALLEFLLKNRT